MPILVREIHSYALHILAHPGYTEIIVLYDDTAEIIGKLCFERDRTSPSVSHYGQTTILHLPVSQYLSYVDILRNESPVFLHSTELFAKIATLQEPAGEEEEI